MTLTATAPVAGLEQAKINSIVFASSIGTVIEWYDFLIYATAAALVFNAVYDSVVPQAVARCASANDIALALSFARQNNLAVTARSCSSIQRTNPGLNVPADGLHVRHACSHLVANFSIPRSRGPRRNKLFRTWP